MVDSQEHGRGGILMGVVVVLLFSGVSACISLVRQRIGAWQFGALTGLLGGKLATDLPSGCVCRLIREAT